MRRSLTGMAMGSGGASGRLDLDLVIADDATAQIHRHGHVRARLRVIVVGRAGSPARLRSFKV